MVAEARVLVTPCRAALIDAPTVIMALAAAVLLVDFRLNGTRLVSGGTIVDWARR